MRTEAHTRVLLGGMGLRAHEHHEVEDALRDRGQWVTREQLPTGVTVAVVTVGLEEARRLAADQRLSKDGTALEAAYLAQLSRLGLPAEVNPMNGVSALNSDDPLHRRLRKPIAAVFTPRRIEALRPRVERIIRELVDTLPVGVPLDLMGNYAIPVSFHVLCELLGLPESDHDVLVPWTHALTAENPQITGPAAAAFAEYLGRLVADRARHPADDLISDLARITDPAEPGSAQWLVNNVLLLIVAGHETTASTIGNLLGVLLSPRTAHGWAALAGAPDTAPLVVEEGTRHNPAVRNLTPRVAREHVEVHDALIEPGELVFINVGAANRDPAVHGPTAAVFDPFRPTARHQLTFGHGIHYCVGAQLAAIEAAAAVRELTTRYPGSRRAFTDYWPCRDSSVTNPPEKVLAVLRP
ncbi:cytochrome P450 [Saccharothrix sp.]|uniref:cytochrome P450 n=1 Tax=Saccharothrix sp. TaxID=1873460 RepID=UPI0028114C37|nr:cytochrome P450 [Saccharothrix sp.]